MAGLSERDRGVVSVYAQGKDYHDLVKRRLKRLGRWLLDQAGGDTAAASQRIAELITAANPSSRAAAAGSV